MSEPLLATEATQTTEAPQTEAVTDDSSSTETTEQPKQVDETSKATETPAGAPESYEFAVPEGFPEEAVIDESIHDAYAEAARDLDLPQEAAQGLFSKTMSALHERAVAEQSRQSDEWTDAVKSDPVLGGDKLQENLGVAKKAINEFGSDGLRDLLESSAGLGNHPEVVRFMFKVGQALSEDRFVGSNEGQAVDPGDEAAIARQLYPTADK